MSLSTVQKFSCDKLFEFLWYSHWNGLSLTFYINTLQHIHKMETKSDSILCLGDCQWIGCCCILAKLPHMCACMRSKQQTVLLRYCDASLCLSVSLALSCCVCFLSFCGVRTEFAPCFVSFSFTPHFILYINIYLYI
jgi:hypothetical protein